MHGRGYALGLRRRRDRRATRRASRASTIRGTDHQRKENDVPPGTAGSGVGEGVAMGKTVSSMQWSQ